MRKIEKRKLRAYTVTVLILLVLSGSITHLSFGTFSSFGFDAISAICPLGAIETALASKTFIPRLFIGLAITVLATLLLGRVFCAWACPIPFVRRWFTKINKTAAEPRPVLSMSAGAEPRPVVSIAAAHALRHAEPTASPDTHSADTRYFVLGGALLSSAVFGFPVFCLICPVGLFFGTLLALMRLVRFNEPTITLLIFPAVLLVEIVLLRKWCHKFCPIGALLSLLGGLNKTMQPRIDASTCLSTSRGVNCLACKRVCPEEIDLHEAPSGIANGLCTKCGDCVDVCPAKAIKFFWREKHNVNSDKHDATSARNVG
ncbi:MAG: 4Fe-4S binding protein [Solidesulfovibrio sp.]